MAPGSIEAADAVGNGEGAGRRGSVTGAGRKGLGQGGKGAKDKLSTINEMIYKELQVEDTGVF